MTANLEDALVWSAIRSDAVESFRGQTPRPEDEAPIIDLFELNPQLVQRAIADIAAAVAAGKITWAWSALRARLERGARAVREATADVTSERSTRVAAAERRIENELVHYDRADHVRAELFGDPDLGTSGILEPYAGDPDLEHRMLTRWRELRPRGILAEQQADAWNRAAAAGRRQILDLKHAAAKRTLDDLARPAEPAH